MEWARYYLEANEGGDGVGFLIKTSHSPENLTYATLSNMTIASAVDKLQRLWFKIVQPKTENTFTPHTTFGDIRIEERHNIHECGKKAFISHPGLREGCHSDQTSIAGRPGAAEPGSLCSFELYIRPRTPLRPAYLPLVGSVSIAMGMEAQPWMGASPANASVGGKPTQEPPPPAEKPFLSHH